MSALTVIEQHGHVPEMQPRPNGNWAAERLVIAGKAAWFYAWKRFGL